MKTFAKFARDRISTLGRSQKALAVELGVSPAYISQIVSGKKNPPDLSKPRNRIQLKAWCRFLEASEEEVLELVRFELHRVPLRPNPRFRNLRELLLRRLNSKDKDLVEEIRSMELHPAESRLLQVMVRIFFILHEDTQNGSAYGPVRFKELCAAAKSNKEFVERDLTRFFQDRGFIWSWSAELNEVRFHSESDEIREAVDRMNRLFSDQTVIPTGTIPVVGHVSAGEGFAYTDGGFSAGEGFEQVDLPPGIDPSLARMLYCVKVRGDSLREFFSDGSLLFIKPESWEEIKDGDLVIFRDRRHGRAFVKKVEFAGDSLILKSMNPLYKNMVLRKSELILLERVMSIVL
jgi:SOS-response transcriptional repressor LexA/transcriptional regulator with XRE-family HTH domain